MGSHMPRGMLRCARAPPEIPPAMRSCPQVRHMGVRAEFMERGGTESGLMSTTSDRDVAEAFATRADENGVPQYSLLFKVLVRK